MNFGKGGIDIIVIILLAQNIGSFNTSCGSLIVRLIPLLTFLLKLECPYRCARPVLFAL